MTLIRQRINYGRYLLLYGLVGPLSTGRCLDALFYDLNGENTL
jgi:hypothetical protein